MPHLSSADRVAICRMILLGQADEAFARYAVGELDQIILTRRANDALRHAATRDMPLKRYFKARIARPVQKIMLTAAVITGVAVLGLCEVWPHYDPADPQTYTLASASAGLLAVCAAATGWAIAAWLTHRNARVQHTINFVANRFTNETFSRNAAAFADRLTGRRIDAALVAQLSTSADEKDVLAVQALRYFVNYFEFVSVGIICGDLDEGIIQRSLRGNLIFYTDRCLPWIRELQAQNPRTLEHLLIIRDHFRDI
ncbi:DUF4760 domain-containing protein [Sphingomonas aracearum]|uniref:DUF4760 domain-containing protein n=1 Tax=Sphingomonas aracearum TaxID=2283317 RepID=A0A369W078_9SPHN|nr:DUF4760 domain-containing protein [Sphingomonas aracearum]RDE07317.1 DUF4760 domain-containing protein [Sphingomonas aracearum]